MQDQQKVAEQSESGSIALGVGIMLLVVLPAALFVARVFETVAGVMGR